MNCYKNMSTGAIPQFLRIFIRFATNRRIKMDLKVFMVFCTVANYCFIEGCKTQSAADVKINVDTEGTVSRLTDTLKRVTKRLFSDSSEQSADTAYQSSYLYPYPFPVYYPANNPVNSGYDQQSNISPQYTQAIIGPQPQLEVQPQPTPIIVEPAKPQTTQLISTQTQLSQPLSTPLIVHREPDSNYQINTQITPTSTSNSKIYHESPQPVFADPQSNYQTFGRPINNPCLGKSCQGGAKCVVRRKPNCPNCPLLSVCVNPCNTARCPGGTICTVEVGHCGNSFCEPRAICKAPCDGVICPGNESCTLVAANCQGDYCDTVPICGRDPCESNVCPLGQGCYLQAPPCYRPPCQVETVCKNVCEGVRCRPGEFCYSEEVTCFKAPCNPIPVCKNPCASLTCPVGQSCVLEQAFCISTPCNPIATCKNV